MSDLTRFIDELKRRKVLRATFVYLAGAFATIQAADVVFPVLHLPERALSLVIGLLALGLPVAVALAWVFDFTADGVTRSPPSADVSAEADFRGWFSIKSVVLIVIMLAIGVAAGWIARSAASDPAPGLNDKSIAVIPFENLSSEEENAYFAIGIQDEILTQLQKISELHVISRSSVRQYQPGPDRASMRTMGEELKARWIVEGSVARVGPEVRLIVQLIDSSSDEHHWAEVYEGDLTVQGLLSFQGQIARRVAESLKATIQPQEAARIVALPTENIEAYDLYLKGIDYFGRRREADLRRALDAFGQAIVVDSSYALAYAGRALVYAVLPFYTDMSVGETTPRGLAAAYQALALDSTVAEAHAALGDLRLHGEYDLEGAETALRRAIQLQPSYAQAHDWLAEALMASGRLAEGVAAARRALQLDPLSLRANFSYGVQLFWSGQTHAALDQLERVTRMDSTFAMSQNLLGDALMQAGRYAEAAAAYRRYADLVGPEGRVLENVAHAAADPSVVPVAVAGLDAIEEPSWRLTGSMIAEAYMRLGERNKAFDWLERAYDAHDVRLPFVFHSPVFAPLRNEERFRMLAARLHVTLP